MVTRLTVVIISQCIQISELLPWTPETNITLYVNYTSIKMLKKTALGKCACSSTDQGERALRDGAQASGGAQRGLLG